MYLTTSFLLRLNSFRDVVMFLDLRENTVNIIYSNNDRNYKKLDPRCEKAELFFKAYIAWLTHLCPLLSLPSFTATRAAHIRNLSLFISDHLGQPSQRSKTELNTPLHSLPYPWHDHALVPY